MTCVLVVIYNACFFLSVIKQIEHSYFLLVIIFVKIFKENFIYSSSSWVFYFVFNMGQVVGIQTRDTGTTT